MPIRIIERRRKPKPQRSERVYCVDCPAWAENKRHDGTTFPAELNENGQPVMKDGQQQFWKHPDGRVVTLGACHLRPPVIRQVGDRLVAMLPQPRSDWFCEDPDKHVMLARLRKSRNT